MGSPSECLERSRASTSLSRYSDRDECLKARLGRSVPRGAKSERKLHKFFGHRMDNTSAAEYVNRLEGTHSLVLSNLARNGIAAASHSKVIHFARLWQV